ncbi:MAG TPA: amylo-alpha-1,6-glucosidase [Casimicrobiaceae bacterium]|nr:amylo-alpha-1,6-glucosidase [Casimicrobiaceae bacterium]
MTPPLAGAGALEWLEADGNGGFASGTVAGYRTRRYHALLLAATSPPTGRVALVNGVEAWLDSPAGPLPLSTQHYGPDVVYPRGMDHVAAFAPEPWPQWTFRFADGTTIQHEIFAARGADGVVLSWRRTGGGGATLHVRPLLSGRDYHALMRENASFDFTARTRDGNVAWRPYAGLPGVAALSTGAYAHQPTWYRNFLYAKEAERGLDCIEDLGAPGVFTFDLSAGEAFLTLRAGDAIGDDARVAALRLRGSEKARRAALSAHDRAAEAFIVRRGTGRTIIAGYPWFTDWGRDTFVAMRGLVLARKRFDVAERILVDWAAQVSEGMLPNRFPDAGAKPQFNAVDASLWFVVVAYEFMALASPANKVRAALVDAAAAILDGYSRGTRYGIAADGDGLLACGEPGTQLTWMDARVGDACITPRIGKPVEVQALWINALRAAGARFATQADRAQVAFTRRFWNPVGSCLYDVVDVDHAPGRVAPAVRPNQIFAVGGLPHALLEGGKAAAVVDAVEKDLVTPTGVRTLGRSDADYQPHYQGGVAQRDGAYHQGTAWPWLMGAFVEAWLRVHGDAPERKAEARARFVAPLAAHVGDPGLGHLFEIADGDPPHTPRGCPFQAWSLGELLRAQALTT